MKKLLIAIMILIVLSSLVFAKLSDEAIEEVDKLRFKHYPLIAIAGDCLRLTPSDLEHRWIPHLNIWLEDGKLFAETQDGNKWFIEMTKVGEEKSAIPSAVACGCNANVTGKCICK